MPTNEKTEYLNVDLEIGSKQRLDALVEELRAKLTEIYRGPLRGLKCAHYELKIPTESPNHAIRELVKVVKKLGPAARKVWKAAKHRNFNVGVHAGVQPSSKEFPVEPEALQDVLDVDGRIVLTVYAPITGRGLYDVDD